jgi:uncharacterized protein (DUF885 family)
MTRIFDIADKYVDEVAALEPTVATALGVPGHEREMPDLSPEGPARLAALNRRTVDDLEAASVENEQDRIARDVMLERLGVSLEVYEMKEHLRSLRNIASPLQGVRQVFDLMPKETEEEWSNVAARLKLVPEALTGYRASLSEGLKQGLLASKRQAREGAEQALVWSGQAEGKPSFFTQLNGAYGRKAAEAGFPETLSSEMEAGVAAAMSGYGEIHRYLAEEYLPATTDHEAAGRDRYQVMSRVFLGAKIDLEETYAWGWQELHRIEDEMAATCERILPGGSWEDVTKLLESDPERVVEGEENYRAWLQELHDEALAELHGRHFDIPDSIRKVEVMIPPPGGALAAYYTGPSEDLKRPGRTWWPTGGNTRFPRWGDVTTVYHEGVPGHHLQVATVRLQRDNLSRHQRLMTFISGHGEGWALYAERLMAELGYLENPDYYLGMLSGQALRAVRVIIDIGLHLELPIPAGETFHPGEVWNHDLAVEFATAKTGRPRQFMESEVVRYLGWPGQAIAYKVGERRWLAIRDSAKRRQGSAFDLKTFHTDALNLGPMGLDQLEQELAGA